MIDRLRQRVEHTPEATAYRVLLPDGSWRPVSWATFANRVDRLAAGFAASGLQSRDRIAICARTSLDWEVAQMAAMRIGASVVGLDPAYGDDLLADLIERLGVRALVAQDSRTLTRIPGALLSSLLLVLTIESPAAGSSTHALGAVMATDAKAGSETATPNADDEAMVVFSSGTTGAPKPVFYCHGQVSLAVDAILETFADIREGSTLVCWLPLANLFQRMINFAATARGATTYIVEDPRTVTEHLRTARPDVFIGVPRFFEKLQAGICGRIDALPPLQAALVRGALRAGQRRARALRAGGEIGLSDRIAWNAAFRWTLGRLRAAFGGNLRYFISGSAPMPEWLLEWFDGIGLPVLEAYGVSESIVPVATNRFGDRRLGTVGKPLSGQSVSVADDGEIHVRGPGVALRARDGQPIDYSSWREGRALATGDLGEFDADGFLHLTGRNSDVFKTSAGKWVAPADIEGRLRRIPHVEHAVVVGAARKLVIALVWAAPPRLEALAADAGAASAEGEAFTAVSNDGLASLRHDAAEALTGLPDYQHPAGLLVLPAERFTVAGGELTTNLKVRRRHVEEKYAGAIDRLYAVIDRVGSEHRASPLIVIDPTGATPAVSPPPDASAPRDDGARPRAR